MAGYIFGRYDWGAKQTGFNENYVSRTLDLAALSPEISGAISRGDRDPPLAPRERWTRRKLPQVSIYTQGSEALACCH